MRPFRDANYNPVEYDGSPVTWRVSCYGLYIEAGTLLVIKHAGEKFWDIPGGGIEPLEKVAAGLARESREEAGWHFELGSIIDTKDDWFYHTSEKRFYHSMQLYSHVTSAHQVGKPTEAKIEQVKFVPLDVVTDLPLYPNAIAALAKLREQKLV
jgi:8-oxo-dGTP pyrophosphatase MutT (NUDIX family)